MTVDASTVSSLYIHVPFCASKCEYCAFYSEAATVGTGNRYTAALDPGIGAGRGQLQQAGHDFLRRRHPFPAYPPTMGVDSSGRWNVWNCSGPPNGRSNATPPRSPSTRPGCFAAIGVNRVSMGVQSLDENLLGPSGPRPQSRNGLHVIRRSSRSRLRQHQPRSDVRDSRARRWRSGATTLAEALALGSEHLSCYEVIYEEDTPLFAQLQAGEFSVDEDLACAMYEELLGAAGSWGFDQYEVANFARRGSSLPGEIPERACQHNVNYWRGGSFEGLGPSAAGYRDGVRTRNWANTTLYCEQLEKGVRAVESREELSSLARAGEIAAFGLRMNSGWPFEEFRKATSHDLREDWSGEMAELAGKGWGQIEPDRFRLTERGLRFADSAAESFLRS